MDKRQSAASDSSFQPIFIVGFPRSGTTLLATLLDRHSRIAIPPETLFFDAVLPRHRLRVGQSHSESASLILRYPRIRDLGISYNELMDRFQQYEPTMQNCFQSLLEVYTFKCGKARPGEKSPVHLVHVPKIIDWYPQAKVLCMMRDGRDVAHSMVRAPWTHNNLRRHAAEWRYRAALAADFRDRYPRKFHVAHFERLIQEPQLELTRVCEHLGESFEARQLNPQVDSGVVPQWEREWKAQSQGPIDTSRLAAWKKVTPAGQLELMNGLMRPQLKLWGYGNLSRVSDLSLIRRLIIWVTSMPFRQPYYLPIRALLSLAHSTRIRFLRHHRYRPV